MSSMKNASQLSAQLKTLKLNDENQVISSCLRKLFLLQADLDKKKARAGRLKNKLGDEIRITKSCTTSITVSL